jgi:hypothetical protein
MIAGGEPAMRLFVLCLLTWATFSMSSAAVEAFASPQAAITAALDGQSPQHDDALMYLRDGGPEVFNAVVQAAQNESYFEMSQQNAARNATWSFLLRLSGHALDNTQRLYWYTDLEAAKRQAVALQRPILMLRLLGNLDEALSCANSRFFRILLYADPVIAAWLRDNVVLCWTSERPVPKVTITHGNGSVQVSTTTGNSAHYLLDAEGRPLDVLPGLVSPQAFLRWLHQGATLHHELASAADRQAFLQTWHAQRLAALNDERAAAMRAEGFDEAFITQIAERCGNPALDAGALAFTKRMVEQPVLFAAMRETRSNEDLHVWSRIAAHLVPQATWSTESDALLVRGYDVIRLPGLRASFATALQADTARNGWRMHATIHQWLSSPVVSDWEALNARIYSDLFLTPANDPWLGLDPQGTLNGLPGGSFWGC